MENDNKKENEEILKKFKERFEEEKKESYDNIQWAGQYIKNSVVCFIYSLVCSALTGIIAGGLLSSGQEGTAGGVSVIGGVIVLYLSVKGFIWYSKVGESLINYKE